MSTDGTTVVSNGDDKALASEALVLRREADGCVIASNADYLTVASRIKVIKALAKKATDFFKPLKQQADAMKKALLEREKAVVEPLAYAEGKLKARMAEWDTEQERRRQQEEARLRELARQQAEEQALQAAQEAEASGNREEADAILSEPVASPVVVVQKETPKVDGIAYREDWKFRIVNAEIVPRQYMIVNEQGIGQVVRALKSAANIPGVEVYSVKTPIVRA